MMYKNSQADIDLCSQFFPNLGWVIQSDSTNRVLYEGKSNTALSLQIEGSLEGYRGFLSWSHDAMLVSTEMPSTSLLAVLQEIKEEWHRIAEGMSGG